MSTRKEKSMRRVFLIGALVACAVVAWAGKGGGGKPPEEDPEFTVAYKDNSIAGRAWVMTASGDTRQSLTGFDVWSATNWTPDGSALLVTAEVDGRGIYTVDLATKARTKLVDVFDLRNSPDWSVSATPNGRQMIVFSDDVVAGGPSNNEALFVAETDGTDVVQLTATETGRIWDHPRFHEREQHRG
jgi:Tol biopolymer transport system component